MKRPNRQMSKVTGCILFAALLLIAAITPVFAQGGSYELIWSSCGGAQGGASGGGFALQGASSQYLPGVTGGGGYAFNVFLGGTPVVFGDTNVDRNVDVADAILVLRHIVGLTTLTGNGLAAADVNRDGRVDVADAILILRFIVGLVPSL